MRYLYYRIYKGLKRVKTNDTPGLNAMYLLMALQIGNVLSLLCVFNHYFWSFKFNKQQTLIGAIILFVVLFIPNYYLIYRKRDEITKRYQNETKPEKTRRIIFLLLYIVITITVFFILGGTIVQKQY